MSDLNLPTDEDAAARRRELIQPIAVGSGAVVVNAVTQARPTVVIDPFGLRLLIISWCLWLLVSWSITLAIGSPVHAVRWVVFSAAFGLMAVWPALRLSQRLGGWRCDKGLGHAMELGAPLRLLATLLDWTCMLMVFQVVVWPLMLVGRWSVQQTLWLDLAVLAWSLLSAALVGMGRLSSAGWARVLAMVLCVLLWVGEPAWMALGGAGFADPANVSGWQMRISPIQALWELTTTVRPFDPAGWIPAVISTATAAGLAWVLLAGMAWWIREDAG